MAGYELRTTTDAAVNKMVLGEALEVPLEAPLEAPLGAPLEAPLEALLHTGILKVYILVQPLKAFLLLCKQMKAKKMKIKVTASMAT